MTTYPSPRSQQFTPSPDSKPAAPSQWAAGRVLAAILACMLLLASLTLGTAGAAVAVANSTHRDAGGYLMSSPVAVNAPGYTLTSANLEVKGAVDLPHQILGDAKVNATSRGEAPVFVGVAKTVDLHGYLDGVRRTQVVAFGQDPRYEQLSGGAPSTAPTDIPIWVAQAVGTGTQTVTWPVENGDWTIVVMNADGSAGVSADVATGATVPGIDWIYGGLFAGAAVFLLIGAVLLTATVRRTGSAT
jgi:hypothetical protein